MMSARRSRRRILSALALAVCLGLAAVASGPLFPFRPAPSHIAAEVAHAPDLDRYLREREAAHPGLKSDLAKGIIWRDPNARGKTPIALVYLHGFSASRRDISPVVETLAEKLDANAFFTRLSAHGLASSDEFATVTAQDWLDDAREALAIGERIGERVVVIGTSTGALLATMAALEASSPRIAALILLSPNFEIRDWRARFISGPLGPWFARLLIGRDYSFEPASPGHAEYWTSRYPSRAIATLMDLVNAASSLDLRKLTMPTLVIYTHNDSVVDVDAIRRRFGEIGAAQKSLVDLPGATRHELTGNALSPQTVQPLVAEIAEFLVSAHVAEKWVPVFR